MTVIGTGIKPNARALLMSADQQLNESMSVALDAAQKSVTQLGVAPTKGGIADALVGLADAKSLVDVGISSLDWWPPPLPPSI